VTRKPVNIAASVKARLLKISTDRGEDFNLLWIRYIHERLLYRLSKSQHADEFVLKGATLFSVWHGEPHRPTKDLDLLARGSPNAARLRAIFAEICRVKVVDDGLTFDPASVTAAAIREDALYDGIRIILAVSMGTALTNVQVDVGFGDTTVPAPKKIQFPTFLKMAAPELRAYAAETVIAEKLEAMITLGMANSRMKDFFDIDYMSSVFDFEGVRLVKAVQATLKRRRTALPDDLPLALTAEFSKDKLKSQQWAAFDGRLGRHKTARSLNVVVANLRRFLEPVLTAVRSGETPGAWSAGGPWNKDNNLR